MIAQDGIDATTPMGATLVPSGATFRVWAPNAAAVYLNGTFGGIDTWTTDQSTAQIMARDASGYWSGFVGGAAAGDQYKFYVVGQGGSGYKRDPYARELTPTPAFPHCNCIIRPSGTAFPWSDRDFQTPDFSNMIVYQLHVGTYDPPAAGQPGTFLDVAAKIEYLVALGINVLQPLPIDELETSPSMGYNGSDYFSPDTPYVVPAASLQPYLQSVNSLRAAKGVAELALENLVSGPDQLRALIDLAHLYGIAVVLDVVYNHAGGFEGDDESLFFWDRENTANLNNSLYFTDQGWAGGLSFALWNSGVRQFLIDSAHYYLDEFHVDGFRYDEISALVALNGQHGWSFAGDLSSTVRFIKPRAVQNAEFWPVNAAIVAPASTGGAGFDVTQHDALRLSVRAALAQCSYGAGAPVAMDAIATALYPAWFPYGWQAVPCVENHDIVKQGADLRLPALADGSDPRSWYARSRSRVASALLLTAPGIPHIFMGQEFLEKRQWSDDPASPDHIDWSGLVASDTTMADHLRFTQDAIALRRRQPALRSSFVNAFHVQNENRVLAFQRMLDGGGRDVIVVATLREETWYGYAIGFPGAGVWREVFNSDAYDHFVNPQVAGNGGSISADGPPLHGFPASAAIVIPANGVVVFARDDGD